MLNKYNTKTIEPIVSPGTLNETKELNVRQRAARKATIMDRFFEKTSTLAGSAQQVPLFLVKEYSLARINAYVNMVIFGGVGVWGALKLKENWGNFFESVIPFLLVALGFFKIIQSLMNLSVVFREAKIIKKDTKNNYKSVTTFITQTYRRLHSKRIDINWISCIYYVIGGIYISLGTLLDGYTIPKTYITFKFIDKANKFSMYNVVKYGLAVVLLFQIFYFLWTKSRINAINLFYDYEIVPNTEILEITKQRNAMWRRNVAIAIFIVFVIPILINRFIKNRKII